MRSSAALLLLVPLATGCFRGGFDPPAGNDLGPVGLDATFTIVDMPQPDLRLSSVNEPCKPPACQPGLTCTWKDKTRFCRPPCKFDARVCADGQACGRPTLGTKTSDPTAPSVCMPTAGAAKIHESCRYLPCEQGLLCINGDNNDRVCMSQCDKDADCGAGAHCLGSTSKGQKICAIHCTSDAQCKGKLRCVGFGDKMLDHCLPNTPVGPNQSCDKRLCGPGMRCFGWPGQTTRFCSKTCPAKTCTSGLSCLEVQGNGTSLCVKQCGLFDKPSKCATGQVCYASAKLLQAYCIPGKGDPTSCGAANPCVSGRLCINGTCRLPCDATHPCPGLMKCATLSAGGKTMPWRACLPL